jgi:hypothetical protein
MRAILALIGIAALVLVVAMSLGLVRLDQQQGASLPKISVNAEGGQLPKFKAETGSIDVGHSDKQVAVPTVQMQNATVSVPTLEVKQAPGASPTPAAR